MSKNNGNTAPRETFPVETLYSFYRPHVRVYAPITGPSMTKQSHKAECDINNILKQYQKTGILQHITQQQPIYTDLPDNTDYQQSLEILQKADDTFSTLPSVVRAHFHNDPGEFLAAFHDPSQRSQLEEWGLINKAPPPRPPDPQMKDESPPNEK